MYIMKPLTTKIVVIIVAASIIAPAAYFAYEYYNKSNVPASVQPFEYIPGNSSMIATVHSNGTEYYIFLDGNSTGIVADISETSLFGASNASSNPTGHSLTSTGNNKSGPSIRTFTYDNIIVYEIKNVSLSALLGNVVKGNESLNFLNTTINIFAYEASGNLMVFGEENAINYSIDTHMTSKDAIGYKSYFDQSANISLYYKVNNAIPTVNYITLNSTANMTYINIMPDNRTDLNHDKNFIQKILNNNNLTTITENLYNITISGNMIHIKLYKGVEDASAIFKVLNTTSL